MLVDKQNELMSNLLFTVHQHGGDDVTWKPPVGTLRNWKIKKAIGLMSKTTTPHVHHAFLHISLQSLYNYDMKWPNFKFTWERERQGDKFYHLCQNLGAVPSLQLQTKFPSLSNRAPWNNREKKWKDAKYIFQRLFLGPRRYRIIRSLMNSKRQLQRKLGHVMKMTWSWF